MALIKFGCLSDKQFSRLLNTITEGFEQVADAISALNTTPVPPQGKFQFVGGGFVRIYAGDRPAEDIPFVKASVADSEGTPLSPQPNLTYTFSSSNTAIASVTDNGNGTVHVEYGTPNQLPDGSFEIAEVKAESNTIDLPDGSSIKDVKTEQIQLLPGQAASFAGGGFQFPENTP